jgi:hypothetical protein
MKDIVSCAAKAELESVSRGIDIDLAPRREVAARLVALLRDAGIACELLAPDSGDGAPRRAQEWHQ